MTRRVQDARMQAFFSPRQVLAAGDITSSGFCQDSPAIQLSKGVL
jgi:hypothetical protein